MESVAATTLCRNSDSEYERHKHNNIHGRRLKEYYVRDIFLDGTEGESI